MLQWFGLGWASDVIHSNRGRVSIRLPREEGLELGSSIQPHHSRGSKRHATHPRKTLAIITAIWFQPHLVKHQKRVERLPEGRYSKKLLLIFFAVWLRMHNRERERERERVKNLSLS